MTQQTLFGRSKGIRIDEPTCSGVIVSGLEVIEACFYIVDIAPVAEGVEDAEGGSQAAR